nr:hypothetical protein [Variovorax boronicumulans]
MPGAIAQSAETAEYAVRQLCPQAPEPGASVGDLVLQHLNARGFVPFHPTLAQHLGHKAALFLGLCLYWTHHAARNNPQRQGWIHLSAREIKEATTLSRREQDTVRAMLVGAGLIEQHLAGRPAVMHFRIKLRQLANRLEIIDGGTATAESAWAWFEKSISFYRPLGDLAGGASGGLYLSLVLRRQRRALLDPGAAGGQVQVWTQEIERVLCLTPKVQRTIRERLTRSGLVTITSASRFGVYLRVNLHAVLACVRGQDIAPLPTPSTPLATSGRRTLASKGAPRLPAHMRNVLERSAGALIQQPDLMLAGRDLAQPQRVSGLASAFRFQPMQALVLDRPVAGTAQLQATAQAVALGSAGTQAAPCVLTAADVQSANLEPGAKRPKRQTGSAQNAKLDAPKAPSYIQTGSTNTTTTTSAGEAESGDQTDCRRGPFSHVPPNAGLPVGQAALVYPSALASAALPGVLEVLAQAPEHLRQPLLDELQGQLLIPSKTIHNPAGWLLGLIRRCGDGSRLALAKQVAQDRQRRAAVQHQLAAVHLVPPTATTHNPQVRQDELHKLMALRGDFARRSGRR